MGTPRNLATSVHPRARGEHDKDLRHRRAARGSSPRTRGTPGQLGIQVPNIRFIPAHAGNTSPWFFLPLARAVHPRARGEHTGVRDGAMLAIGSSPRTRGTPPLIASRRLCRRFIPAHAGNTGQGRPRQVGLSVHPRARGEHNSPIVPPAPTRGSSPRTRGTRVFIAAQFDVSRFIPAHAGNTLPLDRLLTRCHPANPTIALGFRPAQLAISLPPK